jgi:hypothetical protein
LNDEGLKSPRPQQGRPAGWRHLQSAPSYVETSTAACSTGINRGSGISGA